MKRFIEGDTRTQSVLFPEQLDDWIAEDNPVRVVDAFVDELDLRALGFESAAPAATCRPAYHPGTLLKIYLYGYLNRVQSTRRLERESQRNVELIWLTGRLSPDFKTLADFRRGNGTGIKKACAQFVRLCREMGLFSQALIAIDGSKFKAVNNRDRNFTPHKLDAQRKQLESSAARYLEDMDRADRDPSLVPEERVEHLKGKLATVRQRMKELDAIERQMKASPDGQVSQTDPDARSMATSGRGSGIVGYNVQLAVDTDSHLIVAHDVINQGTDRSQLVPMAEQAQDATGHETMRVLADRGYFDGEQILTCEQSGVETLIPKPQTSSARAEGRFDKKDFKYDRRRDRYRCPAGQYAIRRFTTVEKGMTISRYWSSACPKCPIRSACTPSDYRRISRWEHEDVIEDAQDRLARTPLASRWRRQTVEHVFGTLKSWTGSAHFLTRRLRGVRTEMSLLVLAYNLKRAMQILGVRPLIAAIRA
jgi:transposase